MLEKVGSLVTDEQYRATIPSPVCRYDEALETSKKEVRARDTSIDQAKSTTVCGPNGDGAFIGLLVGAIDMIFGQGLLLIRMSEASIGPDSFLALRVLSSFIFYKRFGGKAKGWADL